MSPESEPDSYETRFPITPPQSDAIYTIESIHKVRFSSLLSTKLELLKIGKRMSK